MHVSIEVAGSHILALLKFVDKTDLRDNCQCLCFDVRKTFARVVATNGKIVGVSHETDIREAQCYPPFQVKIKMGEFKSVKPGGTVQITLMPRPSAAFVGAQGCDYTVSYGGVSMIAIINWPAEFKADLGRGERFGAIVEARKILAGLTG